MRTLLTMIVVTFLALLVFNTITGAQTTAVLGPNGMSIVTQAYPGGPMAVYGPDGSLNVFTQSFPGGGIVQTPMYGSSNVPLPMQPNPGYPK